MTRSVTLTIEIEASTSSCLLFMQSDIRTNQSVYGVRIGCSGGKLDALLAIQERALDDVLHALHAIGAHAQIAAPVGRCLGDDRDARARARRLVGYAVHALVHLLAEVRHTCVAALLACPSEPVALRLAGLLTALRA